ncbi:RNA-directed DNA polymerase (Reverse transcriptase) [Trifolium medium]|uniref:RNA-directed DNA polymerase (Reverse transcriptase) n=1 Tax=Trifolium medium TaxID=97028 RepID=A0A392NXS5_9FABA|nr:RNA-directed DNA polymerase (Reverse transcriptase) [Trifolium medium]
MHKNVGGLGFKSIEAFNYAMLGKQAWKLLSNPDNLISKLFKAKYFPRSDFLNSSIGHNPSYVWWSIWSAKFIVRGGYKWSIRAGTTIPVWGQNWTADGSVLTQPLHMNPGQASMTVSELMLMNNKKWNEPLIRALFDIDNARKILQTPLLASVTEDKVNGNSFGEQRSHRRLRISCGDCVEIASRQDFVSPKKE